jgi:sRNA-binding protein
VYERRRKPLKVGIHEQIIAELAGVVPEADIRHALRLYVANYAYLRKIRTGKPRFDLDGTLAGTVTDYEELHTNFELSRRCGPGFLSRPKPDDDPDGKWATSRKKVSLHPANADKPKMHLKSWRMS